MFNNPPCKQQIFFTNKTQRWIEHVVEAKQGTWWHLREANGTETIVNPDNINFIKVYPLSINNKKNERHN